MKRFTVFASSFLLAVSLSVAETPVERHGQLRVQGSQVLDEHDKAVQLRGMSLYWSNGNAARNFYNADVVKTLRDDWRANLVRAAMGVQASGEGWTWGAGQGGYLTDPANKTRVEAVVDAAIDLGMYVIIDWHTHAAPNNQSEAVTFFKEMASKYGSKSNIIYEIYNEPCPTTDTKCIGDNWASAVKPYSQAVVDSIRKIDTKNLIIIGTPTWSQRVDQAASNPVEGDNLLYALHFYAASHKQSVRNYAVAALDKNKAVFSSEFGTCGSSGNGALDLTETDAWLKFFDDKKISWANWSLSAQSESSAALRSGSPTTGNWTDANLTESGAYIRNKLREAAQREDDEWASATLTAEREVPNSTQISGSASIAPAAVSTNFSVGPIPANLTSGGVKFFLQGKSVVGGSILIYDALGNSVKSIAVNDASSGNLSKRTIGSWNLTDAKGRRVQAGAYLVKGKLTKQDGSAVNVSSTVVVGN